MMTAETAVRTPATSAKALQLTPIWEQVLRTRRIPSDVGVGEVLREIRNRLQAGEWEVRQHALRVLADVLSVAGPLADPADLQGSLVHNLGSSAPGVRKAARDALVQLLKYHYNPEQALLDIISSCVDDNVTLGILVALPDLVRPFILPENGGYILQTPVLKAILTLLVNSVPVPIFQNASVDTLLKIRDMCGELRFQQCLADIPLDSQTIQLLSMNLDDSGIDLPLPQKLSPLKTDASWSDYSDGDENVSNGVSAYNPYGNGVVTSEDIPSDGSDDTFTMDSHSSGRLVLETEIKISEEKAITMRIMEDDSTELNSSCEGRFVSADGALVMAVMPSSDEDVGRRTPRRVRFGGEVVKLCTPDSDATDVRIEIQGAENNGTENVQKLVIENDEKPSHIPLPIHPATTYPSSNKPRPKPDEKPEVPIQENLPTIEINAADDATIEPSTTQLENSAQAEISTSNDVNTPWDSSVPVNQESSSDTTPNLSREEDEPPVQLSWKDLGLLDEPAVASLESSVDWKEQQTALEQLERILKTEASQEKLRTASPEILDAFFSFLFKRTKLQNVDVGLSIVGQLMQIIPNSSAQTCLPEVVAGLCRYIGGQTSISTKVMASHILRVLVSRFPSSQSVLHALIGEKCLQSSSSKMRESSLLALMTILLPSPTTNMPPQTVLEHVCRRVGDSRRRVRHAALETLASLHQFMPEKQILEAASKFGGGQVLKAVSCRLARRITPSLNPDGLVQYALQIPSTRRLGQSGPPQGPDVDWILAGKGSLSTGSARSRGQMQAARPPQKITERNGLPQADNPWTAQKLRNNEGHPRNHYEDKSYVELDGSVLGGSRPYYLRLNGVYDEAMRSQRYALHRVADAGALHQPSIRVLTPSALRKQTDGKQSPWTEARNRDVGTIELKRMERVTGRKAPESSHTHRTMLAIDSPIHHITTPPSALFLPSIESPERFRQPTGSAMMRAHEETHTETSSATQEKPRFVEPVVSAKLAELAPTPHHLSQSLPAVTRPLDSAKSFRQPLALLDNINSQPSTNSTQEKLFEIRGRECNDRVSLASAPAAVASTERQSSSSSSTSGSLLPSAETIADSSAPLEVKSVPCKYLNDNYNQKVKTKRKLLGTNGVGGRVAPTGAKFPESLKPFDRPKEGLDTCFSQLDAPQWEVTMQGLSSLTRLVRHHSALVGSHIHALVAALARQIRNLRSQVARAACVVAAEMFSILKRTLEPELEELLGALFHRVADTNRFIRQDSNEALDAFADNIPPHKAIPVILLRGGSHPNAVVRTAVARLFLRITERVKPERILTLPKDIRDKMILSGAGLLTEGRQETRSFAKQLFRVWSKYAGFNSIMTEVIPANLMRNISKTLNALLV